MLALGQPSLHALLFLALLPQQSLAWSSIGGGAAARPGLRGVVGALGARCSRPATRIIGRREAMAGVTTAAFLSQASLPGAAAAAKPEASNGLVGATMAAAPVGFRETKVLVGGQSVPLSVLSPIATSCHLVPERDRFCDTAILSTPPNVSTPDVPRNGF